MLGPVGLPDQGREVVSPVVRRLRGAAVFGLLAVGLAWLLHNVVSLLVHYGYTGLAGFTATLLGAATMLSALTALRLLLRAGSGS